MKAVASRTRSLIETGFACLFVGWSAFVVAMSLGPFRELYEGLGAALPDTTRFSLYLSHPPRLAVIGFLVVVFLIGKEFFVPEPERRRLINRVVFVVVAILSSLAHATMASPMITLLKKVG